MHHSFPHCSERFCRRRHVEGLVAYDLKPSPQIRNVFTNVQPFHLSPVEKPVYYPATAGSGMVTAILCGGAAIVQQGSLELLHDPVAEKLLQSAIPARLAYTWMDGTPRVVPVWFHWTGEQFVIGSPARAPKLQALAADPRVALTIDDYTGWPYSVLMVRGTAEIEMLDDVVPEYALSAERYFGAEQGPAWVSTLRGKPMARIPITPIWVGILDFETRFPSALTA